MAHLLVKQGKSFTDGELVESSLIVAANKISTEKINLFKIVILLMRTVAWRVEDVGSNISGQFFFRKENDQEAFLNSW